ncbi:MULTISPECIES: hypothetical protein [Aeromonas]|uniref:hypothetical protein n=1 Tax=Aeromonas TaxID=642 RepID=UPI001FD7178E|nr:hypothetical protein [Aeromonas veronii]MCJ8212207.1 hypothetical protein [Aeromonas veronii]
MAKKSMFFNITTTNGRGDFHSYIIPARDGFNATQEVDCVNLKVDCIYLGWHDVSIASQQYGYEIIFESNINGQHYLFHPQSYGYRHLLVQFATEVVNEKAERDAEHKRMIEEMEHQSNYPFGCWP